MFENFPYTDMHQLNLDWIVKIAKDFLDQYTTIQSIIENGIETIEQTKNTGIEELEEKTAALKSILQGDYDSYSDSLASQLNDAINDLNDWYDTHRAYLDQYITNSIAEFRVAVANIAAEVIASIPSDYTNLALDVNDIQQSLGESRKNLLEGVSFNNGKIDDQTGAASGSGVYSYCGQFILPDQSKPLYFNCQSGYKYQVFAYTQAGGEYYVGASEMQTGEYVVATPNKCYRIMYSATDNTQPAPTTNPSTLSVFQYEYTEIDLIHELEKALEEGSTNLLRGISFVHGTIDSSTGQAGTSSVWNYSPAFIKVDQNKTLYMKCAEGYKYQLFAYSSNDGTFVGASDVTTEKTAISDPSAYYRIRYCTTANTQPAPAKNPDALSFYQYEIENENNDIIYVAHSNAEFTSLKTAIEYAINHNIKTIMVGGGDWNIISEYGSEFFENYDSNSEKGLPIGKGLHIIFSSDSKVLCNYTGNNNTVKSQFSVFNATSGDFILENCTIEASNVRYCIHDDRSGSPEFYHHKYINCKFTLDNSNNNAWNATQCIGGGFGADGYVEVIGCEFKSLLLKMPTELISWHNSANANAKSKIVIKDCFLHDNGTIAIRWYGISTKMTTAYISNNSIGADIIREGQSGATTENVEVVKWNNTIR